MRVHVVGLPHTQVTRAYDWCAYTAKIRRFVGMLEATGHTPILYAGKDYDDAITCQRVSVVTKKQQAKWFKDYDWRTDVFDGWNAAAPWWVSMNSRAIEKINEQIEEGDAIGIIAGNCQQTIREAFPQHLAIEWGVGYEGIIGGTHCAFESSAWRHYVYGRQGIIDGRHFDAVIPNAFDPDDYTESRTPDAYLLYLGRITPRKGMEVIREIGKRHWVITAGQGEPLEDIEHMGVVLGVQKAELIANAKAVLVPTLYIEPFGGVAVEAMLSGVPVITTDFGAFTETVYQGRDGLRCTTLASFLEAAEHVGALDRPAIAERARARFSVHNVAHLYDEWLQRVDTLHRTGWYDTTPPSFDMRRSRT